MSNHSGGTNSSAPYPNKTERRRSVAATRNMDLVAVIDSIELKPVIVNPNSKFVVITYWWGRGRENRNLQYPCPDVATANTPLAKKPQLFERMIDDWVRVCKGSKCNYLVQEYPEFARPGMYQMAINAKPLFVKKALDACRGRAVVYIDGDMTVNKYPSLFDIDGVDFMARGWNTDPRSSDAYLEGNMCYDNFVFETSGGIMYFNQTKQARWILDRWHALSRNYVNEGKADDRILSMLVGMYDLFLRCNIIELPIEYLWLTELYDPDKDGHVRNSDRGEIIFEHPACLTSEERAADQGAAQNRQPRFYGTLIEDLITCKGHGGVFYEYVFFGQHSATANAIDSYRAYLDYMNSSVIYTVDGEPIPPFYVVRYADRYGPHDAVAKKNLAAMSGNSVASASASAPSGRRNGIVYVTEHKDTEIPRILAYLRAGYDVIYLPRENASGRSRQIGGKGAEPDGVGALRKEITKNAYELVCFYDASSRRRNSIHKYKPTFVPGKPMYISHQSDVLFHLLAMCRTIRTDFNDVFRSSFIFVTRIRCKWLKVKTGEASATGTVRDASTASTVPTASIATNVKNNTFNTLRNTKRTV